MLDLKEIVAQRPTNIQQVVWLNIFRCLSMSLLYSKVNSTLFFSYCYKKPPGSFRAMPGEHFGVNTSLALTPAPVNMLPCEQSSIKTLKFYSFLQDMQLLLWAYKRLIKRIFRHEYIRSLLMWSWCRLCAAVVKAELTVLTPTLWCWICLLVVSPLTSPSVSSPR